MVSILYTFLIVIIWIVNLFNNTGLGSTYHTTEYAKLLVYIITIILVILQLKKTRGVFYENRIIYSFAIVVLFFIFISWYKGYGLECLDYLWAFLLIYIIGNIPVNINPFQLASFSIGILGMIILMIYNYGTIFSGWNSNSIGMIGLNSFLVFIIPFYKAKKYSYKIALVISGAIYLYLCYATNSRSSMLFIIVSIVLALSLVPGDLLVRSKIRLTILLVVPLLISLSVIIISSMDIVDFLNSWSIKNYNKSIFNGRDEIWKQGLEVLKTNLFTGTGHISTGYWHNSAMACLTAFGVVGYSLWIYSFYTVLFKGNGWLKDPIVFGCSLSFILLYLQQSVEMGIFAPNPNLLPYLILGVLLGRVKTLTKENNSEKNKY